MGLGHSADGSFGHYRASPVCYDILLPPFCKPEYDNILVQSVGFVPYSFGCQEYQTQAETLVVDRLGSINYNWIYR